MTLLELAKLVEDAMGNYSSDEEFIIYDEYGNVIEPKDIGRSYQFDDEYPLQFTE